MNCRKNFNLGARWCILVYSSVLTFVTRACFRLSGPRSERFSFGGLALWPLEICRFRNNCEAIAKLWLGRLARRREISLHDKRENVMALISGLLI